MNRDISQRVHDKTGAGPNVPSNLGDIRDHSLHPKAAAGGLLAAIREADKHFFTPAPDADPAALAMYSALLCANEDLQLLLERIERGTVSDQTIAAELRHIIGG